MQVKIMCLRPDEVKDGSLVPPSVEELLKRNDVKFNRKITPDDKKASANAIGLPVMLGVAGMMMALLI